MSPPSAGTRVFLVKPGDVLLIGNAGSLPADDQVAMATALIDLKAVLGLRFVGVFQDDVDLMLMPGET